MRLVFAHSSGTDIFTCRFLNYKAFEIGSYYSLHRRNLQTMQKTPSNASRASRSFLQLLERKKKQTKKHKNSFLVRWCHLVATLETNVVFHEVFACFASLKSSALILCLTTGQNSFSPYSLLVLPCSFCCFPFSSY